MRLAVLADIHGNLLALEAVLNDIQQQGVDQIIVLGDLADRGPWPVECVGRVQEVADICILGNTDEYILTCQNDDWINSDQFGALRWTWEQLGEQELAYLSALSEQKVLRLDGLPSIRFVHGSPRDLNEGIDPEGEWGILPADALQMVAETWLFSGHTHRPYLYQDNGRLAVNPGSVGQPFVGGAAAQYVLLTGREGGWYLEERRVRYDLGAYEKAFRDSDLLRFGGPFARAAMYTALTGTSQLARFMHHAVKSAKDAGMTAIPMPDHLWWQMDLTFNWQSAAAGIRDETTDRNYSRR